MAPQASSFKSNCVYLKVYFTVAILHSKIRNDKMVLNNDPVSTNINTCSTPEVMKIKDMITQGELS